MAINLLTKFSIVKSNIFCCPRFTTSVNYFQTLKSPLHRLRYNDSIAQSKLLTLKFRPNSIITPVRHVKTYQEINTNVSNNVMLYKFENESYFKKMKIFGVLQLIVLLSASYMMYLILPSTKQYETYKMFVSDNGSTIFLIGLPIFTGVGSAFLICFYMSRSIKYIVLNKGGQMASLITYHPTKGTRQIIKPITDITVSKSRNEIGQYMPVRVWGSRLFYLIDREGIFVNPQLFDSTVGLLRNKK